MSKKLIFLSVTIYCVSIMFGVMLSTIDPNLITLDNSKIVVSTKEIMIHNSNTSLILLSGLITFGISTIFCLIINGILLGIIVGNMEMAEVITKILPHGVFEISGLILISTIGLIPVQVIYYKLRRKKYKFLKTKVIQILIISYILIVLAGTIEGWLINKYM